MKKLLLILALPLLASISQQALAWKVYYTCHADRVTIGGTTYNPYPTMQTVVTEDYEPNFEVYKGAKLSATKSAVHISKTRAFEKAKDAACDAATEGLASYFTSPTNPERSVNLIKHLCVSTQYGRSHGTGGPVIWFNLGLTRAGTPPIYGWVQASAWPPLGLASVEKKYRHKNYITDKAHLQTTWDTWHYCPNYYPG